MITSFKFADDDDILMSSKIVIATGCRPYRIVLRKLGSCKYVTHGETLQLDGDTWKHEGYHHGNYFENKDDPTAALAEAHADYNDRAGKL